LETNLNGLIKRVTKPIGRRIRDQFSVFVICLLISVFIWLLIKLSEEDSGAIKYPVIYTNLPEGKQMTGASANHLYLHKNLKGFELINEKFFKKHYPLVIDLSQLKTNKKSSKFNSYLIVSDIVNRIENQVEDYFKMISINPDTIFFNFEDIASKKVVVNLNLTYNLRQQFQLYDTIKISPDSISISGIQSIIDTIDNVSTERMNLSDISENQLLKIPLKKIPTKEEVRFSVNEIDVSIKVEKFTESMVSIPIKVISEDTTTRIRIFPNLVNITFHVALKDFNRIDTGMFVAAVKYDQGETANKMLEIEMINYPEFVKIAKTEPEKVEYIVLK